ncbi:MAG: CofH family radical SAM protein [Candidatus Poseidoniaceae archaeon]|jgi:aminodeoxyfutalosine synthase|nr:CofH family radical SAM protein [Candidatus Poseidoniaceae archaeon]
MSDAIPRDMALAGSRIDWRKHLLQMIDDEDINSDFRPIVNKIVSGTSLSLEDGIYLYNHSDLETIGKLANLVKKARFDDRAFFNLNVHINQTNICTLACKFCAFRRGRNSKDAYALSIDEYLLEVSQYAQFVDEVHSVGGLHPDWDINHYESLFSKAKSSHPNIHYKALTAVEIKHIAGISGISIEETLERLQNAGLGSLPGGGAEILDDNVRKIICNGKESSEEYLEIHSIAHSLGIPTNCTMLFGTIENTKQKITHMIKLRKTQENTGGFQCFVPYPYLPDNSRLTQAKLATGVEILRTIAVSRLMLDNIPHVKAYRMNLGDFVSELALQYGADDIDGTVHKESIMHLAGSDAPLDHDYNNIARIVNDAGCRAVKRNSTYTAFEEIIPIKKTHRKKLPMAQ